MLEFEITVVVVVGVGGDMSESALNQVWSYSISP